MGESGEAIMKSMLRRAKGLEANKFLFTVIVSNTSNVPAGFTSLTVEWKRGRKIVFTQAALVTGGVATFDQELKMVCTLYQDPQDKSYQEKTTRFVVRQRLGKSKKKVGEVEIDLANYANKEGALDAPSLLLPLSKSASGPSLSVTVISKWVGDGDDSDGSECSDMSRTSVDTSMSGASMASSASDARSAKNQMDGLGRPTRPGSNASAAAPRPSLAAQRAAEMATGARSSARGGAPAESAPSPVRSPAAGSSNALSAAVSSASSGAGDSRELSVLRNENRRLAAELKAAQLSLSAARKERDLSRDESRKLKEQLRNSGPARAAAPSAAGLPSSDSFGAINRADGSQERADRAHLDSLSTEDLRSILAAREAELGAVKIRWADSETDKEMAEHKVRRVKKLLHKVGVERDQLARRVTDLEVKLVSK